MLTAASLAALRDVPIADVIGRFVSLKKHGSKYNACCPFHNEKTPSFSVSPAKGMFKCFGCGEGGDAIAFVRRHERLDFREAAELVAEIGGITLEYERDFDAEAYKQRKEERKSLQQLMDECAARYTAKLWAEGCPGMEYLLGRGFDKSTISYWRLGYATNERNALVRHYFSSGLLPQLIRLGLATEKVQGQDTVHYDFFQHRVLFPILNERGEVISFGGRSLGDATPKYLNTRGTDLYDKSRSFFGLYQAQKGIRKAGFAILTEGYTDVISMHRAGADNTVAACGTALTPQQCALLRRYTDAVTIMRDSDKAGLAATEEDIPKLLKAGFKVDVFTIPPGPDGKKRDPDDFARDFITSLAS